MPSVATVTANVIGAGGNWRSLLPVGYLAFFKQDGNDGTTQVMTPVLTDGLMYPDCKHYVYNGIDNYTDADIFSNLTALGTGAFSVCCTFTCANVLVGGAMVSSGTSNNASSFKVKCRDNAHFMFRSAGSRVQHSMVLANNTTYKTVVTSTGAGGTMTLTVNGVTESFTSPAYNLIDNGVFSFGREAAGGGNDSLPGGVDSIVMYDRALTILEIDKYLQGECA